MIWTHAAAGVLALAVGFAGGWKTRTWKAGSDEAVRMQQEAQDAARKVERADSASSMFETGRDAQRERIRVITKEVDRVVDRPIYRDGVCLDDDGLRLIANAVAGPELAGEPASALPAASSAR